MADEHHPDQLKGENRGGMRTRSPKCREFLLLRGGAEGKKYLDRSETLGPEGGEMRTVSVNRREFLRLAGVTSWGLVTAACSPASAPTTAPASAPTTAPASAPTTAPERILRGAVPDFGGADVRLDPNVISRDGATMLHCMYDNAIELGPDGALAPGIVKSWELAPDNLSWVFRLRDDVVFHDGTNVTAADLAFSFEQSVLKECVNSGEWIAVLGAQVRTELIDKYTLRVFTNGPQPGLAVMSSEFPPALWMLPKAYIEKNGPAYFRSNPVGTGPYKFVRAVPGDQIEFAAVDYKHWRVNPEFRRAIEYVVPEETTRIAMLTKGTIDATPVGLESAVDLKKKGYQVITGTKAGVWFWFAGSYLPQAQKSPLSNVKVRQALSLAINRQELIDTLSGGLAEMGTFPRLGWNNGDMTDALRAKWQPWTKENYRYDPVEAKRLIKEAGYADGLAFEFWSAPDGSAPYLADLVMACAGYWAQVGVNATIVPVDAATFKANRHTSTSDKLVGKATCSASGFPVPFNYRCFDCYTSEFGSMNVLVGSPDQARMDALYQEAMKSLDPVRREKITEEMLQLATPTWTGFGVIAGPITFALGPRVLGYMAPTSKQMVHHFADWKYSGKEL
jgi:peptide/nickel transport system substrate-binding protein